MEDKKIIYYKLTESQLIKIKKAQNDIRDILEKFMFENNIHLDIDNNIQIDCRCFTEQVDCAPPMIAGISPKIIIYKIEDQSKSPLDTHREKQINKTK